MRRMGTELGNGAVGRVMVGTDRSQTASKAVGWAAAFAEAYGAELHLVQVVIPTSPTDTEFGVAERTRAAAAAEDLQQEAERIAGGRGRSHVVIDDDGLRQARAEGARRTTRRRGRERPCPPGEAAASGARGAGPDLLQAGPDPLDPSRPDPAGVHHRARATPGQRPSAQRGTGRQG